MELDTLYVLDFSTSQVHIYTIMADQQIEEVEEFIADQGHCVQDCQFIYGQLEVTNHSNNHN